MKSRDPRARSTVIESALVDSVTVTQYLCVCVSLLGLRVYTHGIQLRKS